MPPGPGPIPPGAAHDSPLLALLGAAGADGAGDAQVHWVDGRRTVAEAVASLVTSQQSTLLLVVARPLPLPIRRSGSPRRSGRGVLRHLRRRLRATGLDVPASYLLWPSAEAPRVAWPEGDRRARRWAQRSGLLVTGGGRFSRRALARSVLAGPLLDALAPARVLVVRRPPP